MEKRFFKKVGNWLFIIAVLIVVPLSKECPKMVYAHSGKLIGDGMVMSWEQSRQREAYGN